jgi:hypothetical protein
MAEKKQYHVLYGEDAVTILEREGVCKELLQLLINAECNLCTYNSDEDNVLQILSDSEGWYSYVILTEEQFEYISSNI